ncbi:hypothetical protein BC941DRAFT_457352 [Chlamydoabsidia padenii]|nr:hypothetical protein BC941DRAFT_457352 [Chlamydoabsidia padenii]
MSDSDFDEDEDDIIFKEFRTANERFQQSLLQAKHDSIEQQAEAELSKKYQKQEQQKGNQQEYEDQDQDTVMKQEPDDLTEEIERVKQQIKIAQGQVDDLKNELGEWQHRRNNEAALSRLTTEERATMDQTPPELTPADLDSIFDYLLEMGQMPLHENAAGLDQRDFPESTPSMKIKAMEHPDVVAQRNFSNMTFTKLENTYMDTGKAVYRQCHLEGFAYDIPFTMIFDVNATLEITSLDFDVGVNLQVDANILLSRIKQECNLMALFKLILHYGRLEDAKKKCFDHLKQHYEGTQVNTHWDDESPTMTFSTRGNQMQVKLAWLYDEMDTSQYSTLDVNICDYFMPSAQFTIVTDSPSTKLSLVIDKVPEKFKTLSDQIGVVQATKVMVGSILQEPRPYT